MPHDKKECGKKGHRKHTPITSKKQRALFAAELARRRRGEEPRMPGITTKELEDHLKESKGKKLPKKAQEGIVVTPEDNAGDLILAGLNEAHGNQA